MNTSRLLFTCNLRKQKRVRRIHIFVGRKFHHQNASPYFPLYMRCTILRYPSSIVSASSSRTLLQDQSFDDFIRRLRPLIHFQRSSIWIHFLISMITFCAINNINPSSQNNRDTNRDLQTRLAFSSIDSPVTNCRKNLIKPIIH